MSELFADLPRLAAFLGASLILAVTPGPGVFYIVARSVTRGRRFGLASVAGVAAGNWCNALGTSLGLAAVFAVSSAAFLLVKWAGAAYLVYLGVQAIRGSGSDPDLEKLPRVPAKRIVRDGFVVALLNPKTALFFAAFLPQFMTAGANASVQGAVLGTVFVAVAAVTDSIYALAASSVSAFMSGKARRGGRFVAGGVYIALGVYVAATGNRRLS